MKAKLKRKLSILFILGLSIISAKAQFSGAGLGTSIEPYMITNADQLNEVRNNLSAHYALANDVDLADWLSANSGTTGWSPIGTTDQPFSGSFNGNGFFITGLWVNSAGKKIGLFGVVGGINVAIKNLGLIIPKGKSIKGVEDVGGLIGSTSDGTIAEVKNCCIIGSIESGKNGGAILGLNIANAGSSSGSSLYIENCYAAGSVRSTGDGAGGLVGSAYNKTITDIKNSYTTNSVQAASDKSAAGIMGSGSTAGSVAASNLVVNISNVRAMNSAIIDGGTAQRIHAYMKGGVSLNLSGNLALDEMKVKGKTVTGTANDANGLNVSAKELANQTTYGNWDFSNQWIMGNESYPFPVLKALKKDYQPKTLPDHLRYNVNITTSSSGNGIISSHPGIKVGDNVTITLTPGKDCEIISFTVNGAEKKSEIQDNKYTLTNVSEDYTIIVKFTGEGAPSENLKVYSLPSCYQASNTFALSVNNSVVPISRMFGIYEYAHYSFSGNTTITVTANEEIETFSISPLAYNIQGYVEDNTLTFDLNQSQYLIVKINDLPELIIAADDLETNVPASSGDGIFNVVTDYNASITGLNTNDVAEQNTTAIQQAINDASAANGGTVYIPQGVYYCKNIVLKSNVNIYMEAGAVIRGTGKAGDYIEHYRKNSIGNRAGSWFLYTETQIPLLEGTDRSIPIEKTKNIKIYGRGIIDGNGNLCRKDNMLMALLMPINTENFTVDGIVFRDSGLWAVTVTRSKSVKFLNTKHFNENNDDHENDAVDVQESQDVVFKHSIAISEDDTYSTKTWENWTGDITKNWPGPAEDLDNVVFDDCVAWSRCASFKVGFGVHQNQSNIVFKNSIAYKCMRAIAINHKYKPKTASNITFENIDIEGYWARSGSEWMQRWFELDIESSSDGGAINDVYIKDINVRHKGTAKSVLKGLNQNTKVTNVTFENILMPRASEYAVTLNEMNITDTNDYVENIVILPGTPTQLITNEETSILVYPNPTEGILNFNINEPTEISIYDNTGKLLKKEVITSSLDISDFASGIYHLRIKDNFIKIAKK